MMLAFHENKVNKVKRIAKVVEDGHENTYLWKGIKYSLKEKEGEKMRMNQDCLLHSSCHHFNDRIIPPIEYVFNILSKTHENMHMKWESNLESWFRDIEKMFDIKKLHELCFIYTTMICEKCIYKRKSHERSSILDKISFKMSNSLGLGHVMIEMEDIPRNTFSFSSSSSTDVDDNIGLKLIICIEEMSRYVHASIINGDNDENISSWLLSLFEIYNPFLTTFLLLSMRNNID